MTWTVICQEFAALPIVSKREQSFVDRIVKMDTLQYQCFRCGLNLDRPNTGRRTFYDWNEGEHFTKIQYGVGRIIKKFRLLMMFLSGLYLS